MLLPTHEVFLAFDWENPEEVTSGVLCFRSKTSTVTAMEPGACVMCGSRSGLQATSSSSPSSLATSSWMQDGKLSVTVLAGEPFAGTIEGSTVTLAGYPFSSKNATLSAEITFRC
jgi:hypothetical protein